MKVYELKSYQLKQGMKLKDPNTGMIGEITKVEFEMGDTYTWVKWENSDRLSGFWGMQEDFEVLED
jgi:hypothetical protein